MKAVALALVLAVTLAGCTRLTLDWAALTPEGAPAEPPVLAALAGEAKITSSRKWGAERRPLLKTFLQNEIYGQLPPASTTNIESRRLVDDAAFGGLGTYEEYTVRVSPSFAEGASAHFTLALAVPKHDRPVPVLIMETFCPRHLAMPHPAASPPGNGEPGDDVPGIIRFVFGRHICTPPVEDVLEAGYAVAVLTATDIVPDDEEDGKAALRALSAGHPDDRTRWGAIAAWAWTFSRAVDVLIDEPRIDPSAIVTWGHSRYGKAALLAAAFDDRIGGVIAHQSGTGGASLTRDKKGESVAQITREYPHWFAEGYADAYTEGLSIDQHHLLALIAPRPMFLGNARRDVWSDPNGAFRAAQSASAAYQLYGVDAFPQDRLDQFNPQQQLVFWLRPGTHGIVEEDWPAFLTFLDAHFGE